MSRYAKQFNTKVTQQSESIPGSVQVKNSSGGFSFEVNDWVKLDRFMLLGTEGGSYYATERELTVTSAEAVLRCLQSDGLRLVRRVVEISEAGRAPKNDPAIFVLAIAAKRGNDVTRKAALEALPRVCRIGTHLFQFVEAMESFGGWGRGTRRAVGSWYTSKSAEQLAYQLVKYRKRGGWSHRDILRLAKPVAGDSALLKFAVGKPLGDGQIPSVLEGYLKAESATDAKEIVQIIADHPELPWEAIPTKFMKSPDVFGALLPNMPVAATIRMLNRMTAYGLLGPLASANKVVTARLSDEEAIRKSKVHPVSVLAGLLTYKSGRGIKGDLSWNPVREIVDALDGAFYLAFGNVEPSNKRTLIALDVSGSMSSGVVAGIPGLTPRVGSAAMAMVTARVEPEYTIAGFTSSTPGRYGGQWDNGESGLTPIDISPRQRLDDVCKAASSLPMGGTDCALPMIWAAERDMQVDTFLLYTDSETWAGKIHPKQALDAYRQKTGIPAKLVVVAMLANPFSIADQNDSGMLDVVGFDTATPSIISEFSKG